MLIMVSGSTGQKRKGMLCRRSGAAVTGGAFTTGSRFVGALCLRCCFAISAELRVGFFAERATRFFALALVDFIFRVFFMDG
jgi:hypothetical protein